jgi:hypothetical protein
MVFVGWNDGLLTYPPEYKYTVTEDLTFNARWAFTTLDKITACLTDAGTGAPVLIAVYNGGLADEDLTWQNLLSEIETAGEDQKSVELDLTGSTLALFSENDVKDEFDYKDGGSGYGTGEKYIKKLVLPSAAKSIKTIFSKDHFSGLEAVSGLNVSAIPDNAFAYISTLAAVVFPEAKTIGNNAFKSCASLTDVSLPEAETIDNNAFIYCYALTGVSLPAAKTIGNNAFNYCTSLTSVNLPEAKTIGTQAFEYCVSLTSVSLPKAEFIGINAFSYSTKLTEVSLPEAGTMSASSFQYCFVLAGVSLPKATLINTSAFYSCYNLTNITIAGSCTINDTTIRGKFKDYYDDDNGYGSKATGGYTYSKQSWSYTPPKE